MIGNSNRKIINYLCIIFCVIFLTFLLFSLKSNNTIKASTSYKNTKTTYIVKANELIADTKDSVIIKNNGLYLQRLIDEVSNAGGGIVRIPKGKYYFGKTGENTSDPNREKNLCWVIECKDNVTIDGEGEDTVLLPVADRTDYPLDMFSSYNDQEKLINANFKNFTLDAINASEFEVYTGGGKGFDIQKFQDCNWTNVIVKNTAATGFGMKFPINSTVINCKAINCGRNLKDSNTEVAGFGIGIGASEEETMTIRNCIAIGNKKTGFYFGHQSVYNTQYNATKLKGIIVEDCEARGNMYDFGGEKEVDVKYIRCVSLPAKDNDTVLSDNVEAFHLSESSRRIEYIDCFENYEFSDMDTEQLKWCLNKNIISSGKNRNEFYMKNDCTMGMAITFLWKYAGTKGDVSILGVQENLEGENADTNGWWVPGVLWARKEEIIIPNSDFNHTANCLKKEFIEMIWKYSGSPKVELDNTQYKNEWGENYYDAINWAINKKIIKNAQEFKSAEVMTREECINILYAYEKAKYENEIEGLIPNSQDLAVIKNNSLYLQKMIDEASKVGETVHIPSGTYYFGAIWNDTDNPYRDTTRYWVINCRDNVTVEGEGENTILMPIGATAREADIVYSLDMFYHKQEDGYLKNADFKNFVIDATYASYYTNYVCSGKGFFLQRYENCDWENVIVKNTAGTGFGMDFPINCTITNCIAINCGKNAPREEWALGASGFGIGTGASDDESILIKNCISVGNTKYGFFFEHQSRFSSAWTATKSNGFVVEDCEARGNMFDFGGERGNDVTYIRCTSSPIQEGEEQISYNKESFNFGNSSRRVTLKNCKSNYEFEEINTKELRWAINKGIIKSGQTTNSFNTSQLLDRGMAVTFLWRMFGQDGDVTLNGEIDQVFDDVPTNEWYADAALWARNKNIIVANNNFYPSEKCQIYHLIAMLWKYSGSPKASKEYEEYKDKWSWGYESGNWAIEKGIITDVDGYEPMSELTKEEAIKIMYAYEKQESYGNINNIPNGTYIIGKHIFDRETNEVYNGKLTTKYIMLASKTISSNSIEDMIIYYKTTRGKWVDGLTGEEIAVPGIFDIKYYNGIDILEYTN